MTHRTEDPGPFEVRSYRRAWWLPGAHLQTIGAWLLRSRAPVPVRRERLETPDGDFVDLDFALSSGASNGGAPERIPDDSPLVMVLHGLEGGSTSLPALSALRSLASHGLRAVAMNFRSCSGEPNRGARFYHAGDTEDLALVIESLRQRFPSVRLGALGYSLGGNVLLKYLGERGSAASDAIEAAAAISVPFDLMAGARRLERGFGRIYTAHFLRSLLRKFEGKASAIGEHCDLPRVRRSRTLREFDDAATAPLHGFRDVEHYYGSSSSAQFLPRVRVPTLLLHAADDPFLPAEAVPRQAVRRNPALLAEFTEHGGHMGFVTGPPWAPGFWAEAEAARFLAWHLHAAAATGSPGAGATQ